MHPLHSAIGGILLSIDHPNVEIWLDAACGGKDRQIRLYGTEPVAASSCLAWVDAAIVVDGEIKVVLEIEESNVRPLYLCGKVFATALCSYSSRGGRRTPIAASILFIQVIKLQKKAGSAKLKQCEYLEATINQIFKKLENRVHTYSFHYGLAEDFITGTGAQELRQEILDFMDRLAQPKTINQDSTCGTAVDSPPGLKRNRLTKPRI
jgi:hypothetical protein